MFILFIVYTTLIARNPRIARYQTARHAKHFGLQRYEDLLEIGKSLHLN